MERCVSCGRAESEVKLFDGFYVNASVKMCERCSLINGVPIIKRPSTSQLKDAEKPYQVRSRLLRMAHINPDKKDEKLPSQILKEIEEKPELEQPEDLVFQLIDNFHWAIQTERRRKGYSQKQLAEAVGESETAIKMLEKGIVPSKSLDMIRAIEQLLKVKLVKRDLVEQLEEQRKKEAQLKAIFPKSDKTNAIIPGSTAAHSVTISKPDEQNKQGLSFSKRADAALRMRDLQRNSDRIDRDFDFSRKSREQVGNEQMEDIGKEDTDFIKKTVYKESLKQKSNTPSIYELMKKKEEKEKTSMTGDDIKIANDSENKNKEFNM